MLDDKAHKWQSSPQRGNAMSEQALDDAIIESITWAREHGLLPGVSMCSYCDAIATHHGEGEDVCKAHIHPVARDEYRPIQRG